MSTDQIRALASGQTITFNAKTLTVKGMDGERFVALDNETEISWMLTGLTNIPEIT